MHPPEPVLSDGRLREQVLLLAPGLPAAAWPRIRVIPAREAGRGDVSTDAALVAAGPAAMERGVFAGLLALRLGALAGIASAQTSESGHVNLRYSDAALGAVLAAAAMRAAAGGGDGAQHQVLRLPVAGLVLSDPVVAIQYAHARCRSVLRAAAALGLSNSAPDSPENIRLDDDGRRLLCRIEHWLRIRARTPSPQSILLYLQALSEDFERLWQLGGDDATLRFLYPGDPGRSLAGVALVSATAGVIRAGLARLGMVAAEELQ